MIREIITNHGTFGSFKDIYKFMKIENHDSIEIKSIRNWDGSNFDRLVGVYNCNEIEKVVE